MSRIISGEFPTWKARQTYANLSAKSKQRVDYRDLSSRARDREWTLHSERFRLLNGKADAR